MAVVYASARDRLGQTLGGKYVLEDVFGVGGTAVVYRAKRPDGTVVALKMLHDHLCTSTEVCRRFKREAYVANILEHPGTVRVLDDGMTDDGALYLVLEPLTGESVEERRLRFGGTLPLDEVLLIADQLLAVLEIAHAKNVIHRDIKPSNLFVDEPLELKVLDFGIARILDDNASATSTKTGQMVGTPAFMPPEQALSRPREVDVRTDIWAVGATMFTLLSGQHVHLAESSSEHLVKAATLHARSLAKALPGVPTNVEALVAKALSFAKDDRWSSATAMRLQLANVRLDPGRRIGISAPPPARMSVSSAPTFITDRHSEPSNLSVIGDAPPPTSKRSLRAWTAGAIVLAAALAGTLGFLAARSTRTASASSGASPPPMTISMPPPPATTTAAEEPLPPPPAPAESVKQASPAPRPAAVPTKKAPAKPATSFDVYKPF